MQLLAFQRVAGVCCQGQGEGDVLKELWVSGPPSLCSCSSTGFWEAGMQRTLFGYYSPVISLGKHDFTCTHIQFSQLKHLLFKVANQPKTHIFFSKLPLIVWLATIPCAKFEKHSGKFIPRPNNQSCASLVQGGFFFFGTATISS